MRYCPCASVAAENWPSACGLLSVTIMPGSRPPLESTTRPPTVPVPLACASASVGSRTSAEAIAAGMTLYRVRCADCHGIDAGGYRGPDLIAALAGGMTDERLFSTIRKGVPGTDMPPQGIGTADDDILQMVAYLRNLGNAAATE